jgi:hypothetical protein
LFRQSAWNPRFEGPSKSEQHFAIWKTCDTHSCVVSSKTRMQETSHSRAVSPMPAAVGLRSLPCRWGGARRQPPPSLNTSSSSDDGHQLALSKKVVVQRTLPRLFLSVKGTKNVFENGKAPPSSLPPVRVLFGLCWLVLVRVF